MVNKWSQAQWQQPGPWQQAQQANYGTAGSNWRGKGSHVQDAQDDNWDNQNATHLQEKLGDTRAGRPQSIQPSPDQPVQPVPQDQPVPQVQPAPGLQMEPNSSLGVKDTLAFSEDETEEASGHADRGRAIDTLISTDYAHVTPSDHAHLTPAPITTPIQIAVAQAQASSMVPTQAQAQALAPALAPALAQAPAFTGTFFNSCEDGHRRQAMAQKPAMTQAGDTWPPWKGGTWPPGDLNVPPQGTPGNLMPPHGNLVPLGHIDSNEISNAPIYNSDLLPCSAEAQHGNSVGDRMPLEWRDIPCVDVWRGKGKGKLRPAIDIKKAKNTLEKRDRNPDKRFSDDQQANNRIPTVLLNEYKQTYMDMQWSMTMDPLLLIACSGAATTYIPLCIWKNS